MHQFIRLRGVEVHNLKQIDLDIPHRKLVVLCGVSGSGKSSLALDTLFVEGQRRYLESFSAQARQFLDRLERPQAELLEGIPATVAVTHWQSRAPRATIATATEIHDYLRLLFARCGTVHCAGCGHALRRSTAATAGREIRALPAGRKLMLAFPLRVREEAQWPAALADLAARGFRRMVCGEKIWSLESSVSTAASEPPWPAEKGSFVIVDRLTTDAEPQAGRLIDSLETAFHHGDGTAVAFVQLPGDNTAAERVEQLQVVDGQPWQKLAWSNGQACAICGAAAPRVEPRLFSFQSPHSACAACEGLGTQLQVDPELVIPNPHRTLRDGAVALWKEKGQEGQFALLLELAREHDIPLDLPFAALSESARQKVDAGIPGTAFVGVRGCVEALCRSTKAAARNLLAKYQSPRPCLSCQGQRLKPEGLAVRWRGKNIAELCALTVAAAADWLRESGTQEDAGATDGEAGGRAAEFLLARVHDRLKYLQSVGLGYLRLDRPLTTLSGGEARRVRLAAALGSSLVNMLYILDEPTAGLHPHDTARLLGVLLALRDRGNTVLVVEHEEAILRAADHVIEFGPGAGCYGGKVVFAGPPADMLQSSQSIAGAYLRGERGAFSSAKRISRGRLRLIGARGHNLKNLTVEFPIGMLCAVTGVSGAGKSSLVVETLYPALCQQLGIAGAPRPLPYDNLIGEGQLTGVVLVDGEPPQRSHRSNPATYIKVFDDIRALFAEATAARIRNYTPSTFSFNVEGGRCETCRGEGKTKIDLQFLPDITVTCPRCNGRRYLPEVLQVRYRDRNIAEVLEMTVREAFSFFRGQRKIQAGLKRLLDVGLDYVALGQSAETLSSGEAQRLKLAGHLAAARSDRTLFILEEPTTGLHFADVLKLLDCFTALLEDGHTIIVIEHNVQLLRHADYIIDLGPGAANEGGAIVAQGTPAEVAACKESITGRYLASASTESLHNQSGPTRL